MRALLGALSCFMPTTSNQAPLYERTSGLCRLNLSTNWAECSALNLQGSFTKRVQHQLQSHKGLGPPSLSDSDWQQIAHNSLPAALQHLMWPANGALSPQAQVSSPQLTTNKHCHEHLPKIASNTIGCDRARLLVIAALASSTSVFDIYTAGIHLS